MKQKYSFAFGIFGAGVAGFTWLVGTGAGLGAGAGAGGGGGGGAGAGGGGGGGWWGEPARLDFFGAAGAGGGIERRFLAARNQRPKATDQRHPVAALRASGPLGMA